ncbi:MAG: hypothetical protein LCH53_10790 [Bacteroidetes bacterium]|nr:hypothetical protein [Bacteroidota bacterium]
MATRSTPAALSAVGPGTLVVTTHTGRVMVCLGSYYDAKGRELYRLTVPRSDPEWAYWQTCRSTVVWPRDWFAAPGEQLPLSIR